MKILHLHIITDKELQRIKAEAQAEAVAHCKRLDKRLLEKLLHENTILRTRG